MASVRPKGNSAMPTDEQDSNPAVAGGTTAAPRPSARFRYSEASTVALPVQAQLAGGAAALPRGEMNWPAIWVSLAIAAVLMAVFYQSAFLNLFTRWSNDAGWSHGFVVPLIALFFIRIKWDTLRELSPRGSFWGVAVLLAGVCAQTLFRATGLVDMSNLSILVVLFGVVLFVFGWEYMKILWLPIGFLIFAVPPPTALYVKVTTPMQNLAPDLAVLLLPMFGLDGHKSGTVIAIAGLKMPLNVAEACAGMRMLVAFCALAVALGYSTHRPIWQKVTLGFFALPIAIICNGFRVALTGVMSVKLGEQYGQGTPHEFLGLVMLIPAMLMLIGIGWALNRIFIEEPDEMLGART